MCPVCLSTAALIAASITSTGGLAAIAIRKVGEKHPANKPAPINSSKENHHA